MSVPHPRRWALGLLRSPARISTALRGDGEFCNAPYVIEGVEYGYCRVPVWGLVAHKCEHRLEWPREET